MKKSCFLKFVVVLTILIGGLVYIIQYKMEDWFIKPGKEYILNEAIKNLDDELIYIPDSANKDSLKSLAEYFFTNVKSFKEIVNLEKEIFTEEFKRTMADSIITDNEI